MNIQKLHISPSTPLKAAAAALILLAIAVSLTAYPLPAQAQALSTDATLSALTVSPKNIIGFRSDRFAYDVGVDSTVTEATITATPTDSNAEVSFDSLDSNDGTDGHQVALSAGRNTVTITVTAEDNIATQEYTVSVNRGVSDNYGWNAERDLDAVVFEHFFARDDKPIGIVENNGIFWITSRLSSNILAYRQDGSRFPSRDTPAPQQQQLRRHVDRWPDPLDRRRPRRQAVRLPTIRRQPPTLPGVRPAHRQRPAQGNLVRRDHDVGCR